MGGTVIAHSSAALVRLNLPGYAKIIETETTSQCDLSSMWKKD
jgi:hypothetical protein